MNRSLAVAENYPGTLSRLNLRSIIIMLVTSQPETEIHDKDLIFLNAGIVSLMTNIIKITFIWVDIKVKKKDDKEGKKTVSVKIQLTHSERQTPNHHRSRHCNSNIAHPHIHNKESCIMHRPEIFWRVFLSITLKVKTPWV